MNLKYYAHPSSIIDEHCEIGEGTKIWHFRISCQIVSWAKIVIWDKML